MKQIFLMVAAIGALVLGTAQTTQAAPAATTSRYVQTLSYNTLYNEGCSMGKAGLSGVVVLDFGQPNDQNGVHGVYTLGSFWASPTQVEADAEAYLDGFWNCSGSTPFLHLSIGQSNYGSQVGYSEGQTWGNVINAVNNYISTKGYGSQEAARGGFDSEPGWSAFSPAADQVNGYANTTKTYYYDFGSADGCPPYGSCSNNWGDNGLWYIAWGNGPAFSLPEIYYQANATQWQTMSLYSAQNKSNGKDQFLGTMTEYAADSSTFTPAGGFNALQNALNANSATAWNMSYSTDITWAQ
ncbi:MAG: hypothetical protein ABR584_02940 [Candidatus Baltobacteraceae bacterium]